MRIIEDIHYNSKSFKKSWFLKRYPDAINEKLFDDFFSDNNSLKKGVVLSDIKKLESRTKKIKDYADKWEAHWDEKRHKIKSPTYNDLDLAVNSIVKIYKRYYYLLKQAGLEFSEF